MRAGPEWFILIETLGILSFAINAILVGEKQKLSTLGLFTCAVATALGGGTLRDILLGPQAQPFFWVAYPFYIVAIFGITVAYAKVAVLRSLIARRDFIIKETAEAIALASLGALGAAKTYNLLGPGTGVGILDMAHLVILCAFLGVVGSAFGSILRDTLLDSFPGALRPGVWVLEAIFLGGIVLALLRLAGVAPPVALLGGFLTILTIRATVVLRARPVSPR